MFLHTLGQKRTLATLYLACVCDYYLAKEMAFLLKPPLADDAYEPWKGP